MLGGMKRASETRAGSDLRYPMQEEADCSLVKGCSLLGTISTRGAARHDCGTSLPAVLLCTLSLGSLLGQTQTDISERVCVLA